MSGLNKYFCLGRLTRDPESKQISGGKTVCKFGVAVNRKFKDQEETLFLDVTAWEQTAKFISDRFRKGERIFIEGRLKLEQWEKDGVKNSKITLIAETVQPIEPNTNQERQPASSQQSRKTNDYGPPEEDIPF